MAVADWASIVTLDGLAVACLADELHARLLGHRVQHVHHTGHDALALECYGTGRRSWLVACAHPSHPALWLADARPPRPADEVTPLLLRLRKLVDGAVVAGVSAPPLERVVRIELDGRGDDGPYRVALIVELLGPGSVTLLVDGTGVILEASRRSAPGASGGGSRSIMPRERYLPPTASDRLDPRTVEGGSIAERVATLGADLPLPDAIVRVVAACSPQLAREVIATARVSPHIAAASATIDGLNAIAAALRLAWARAASGYWAPSLFVPLAGQGGRVAFAPYPLQTVGDAQPVASISEAIAAWHDRAIVGQVGAAEAAASRALRQAIEARLDKARARQFSLTRSLADQSDTARLRSAGEWLLAHPDRVAIGAASVVVDPSEVGQSGPVATVALDPALGAVANAQRLFKRYQKAKAAAREVPPLLEAATRERGYLEESVVHLDLARSADEVRALRDELAAGGFVSAGKREPNRGTRAPNRTAARGGKVSARGGGSDGTLRISYDDYDILVGQSGRGNDAVLRTPGHPDDPWLHARGVAGAHVLVRSGGRTVPEAVIRAAAAVAAGRSASRGAPTVPVDVTARRHVTRVSGGPPGLVTYRNERTIQVQPASTVGSLVGVRSSTDAR